MAIDRLVGRVDASSRQQLEWQGLGLPLAPTLILGFRSGTSDS
jgi:hypothetical protein